MNLNRRNPRRDANERAIVQALTQLPGCIVYRQSGPGLPDLLVGYRKQWVMLEVKGPRGRSEPLQIAFHATAQALGLPCHTVRNVDQALQALGVKA